MGLKDEIIEKRREMVVDSYPMSIGEMVNLYRDGELNVHPEFQRSEERRVGKECRSRWEPAK